MTSDIKCLEMYKNVKTMHWSKTWINLHRFLDFANTCIISKTCLALSWEQTLLSYSWINRFQAGNLNHMCLLIECNNDCCITFMCIHGITVTSDEPLTPGPPRPHAMHINPKNLGISRMWTDWGKSHYTFSKVHLTKSRLGCGLLLSPATKLDSFI